MRMQHGAECMQRSTSPHPLSWRRLSACALLAVLLQLQLVRAAPIPQDVCVSVAEPLVGGVANSLSLLSTVLTFVKENPDLRLRFVFPLRFAPKELHGARTNEFRDLVAGPSPVLDAMLVTLPLPVVYHEMICAQPDEFPELVQRLHDTHYPFYPRTAEKAGHARCPPDMMGIPNRRTGKMVLLSSPAFAKTALELADADFAARGGNIGHGATLPPEYASCRMLVALPGHHLKFHHNYTVSGPILADRYLQQTHGEPPRFVWQHVFAHSRPINVAIHHRLGDVDEWLRENRAGHVGSGVQEKRMSASWPVFAFLLFKSVLVSPEDCLSVHIFSDGPKNHPDFDYFRRAVPPTLDYVIYSSDSPPEYRGPRFAFDVMTFSDILITGTSGFSRLAAVFTRNVVLAPPTLDNWHPLGYLDHVLETVHQEWFWDWRRPVVPSALENLVETDPHWKQVRLELIKLLHKFRPDVADHCGIRPIQPAPVAGGSVINFGGPANGNGAGRNAAAAAPDDNINLPREQGDGLFVRLTALLADPQALWFFLLASPALVVLGLRCVRFAKMRRIW